MQTTQRSRTKIIQIIVHTIAWAMMFGSPLFFSQGEGNSISWGRYLGFCASPLAFMLVFYLNYFVLIDRLLFRKRLGAFVLINLLLIILLQFYLFFMLRDAVTMLLITGLSVAIKMTGRWYRVEREKQEIEKERTQAELQNLKSQLNPHFLFNTLNNIYSLIQIDADRAQQAVHDLSRMLRYVLYESSCPTVPLAAEVEFLRDYIELMRIRLPRHVEVGVSLPEEPSPTPVAPLLFISLIENAFKHGTSNDGPSFIRIDIHERDGELVCRIRNSCFPKTASDRSGSGIGLKNLSKRLEMIYPQRHTFEYGERGGTYTASLRIKLHER